MMAIGSSPSAPKAEPVTREYRFGVRIVNGNVVGHIPPISRDASHPTAASGSAFRPAASRLTARAACRAMSVQARGEARVPAAHAQALGKLYGGDSGRWTTPYDWCALPDRRSGRNCVRCSRHAARLSDLSRGIFPEVDAAIALIGEWVQRRTGSARVNSAAKLRIHPASNSDCYTSFTSRPFSSALSHDEARQSTVHR